ncbi:MAG: hypothetical protein P3T54_00740 [Dehalogenimonas sp.]|jgi:hypothetical protein|uniref:Uncharacterized protein n=1 Tax=Candidatus Dehalogenimonas loeffleri TaxID=3127115 RepID=A0ABZ2J4N6_9CHLR|nr:hypothetical protein [Dehalogenimonas sp.]
MDHKTAIDILLKLAQKPALSTEEKEAVMTAVGVLGWTSLAQSRLKDRRDKPPGS